MNKWAVRMVGVILLLVFALVLIQMYSTLTQLARQQQKQPSAATATASR